MDETPVAESEGKRSSMGQMVPAGCARDTVPARLYKRRLQCWAHGTILHVTSSNVAVSTLKAPFTHDTILHRSHRAAPHARLSPQSGRKSFVRACSLHVSSRPVLPSSALRGLWGSRVSYRVPPPLSRVPRQPRRSSPLLSGAQTGHFPASLPRTFGAACMARLPASPSTVYQGRI